RALHAPHLVLQLPARAIECVVDGKERLAVALIAIGCPVNVDPTAFWERKMDAHPVIAPAVMVLAGQPHDDTTGRDPSEASLQIVDAILNMRAQQIVAVAALKIDFDGYFHDYSPMIWRHFIRYLIHYPGRLK
ncbi:MAG: hypothetical protein H6R45_744, partial [Proteobacteria bacterium]|nr:hypothetical protein [Pseudomonadota bacterium]